MHTNQQNNIARIMSYTPAKLHTGKIWYVDFNAYNPAEGCMKRKRIKVNFVKENRRKYANELVKRLNQQLLEGWNPWIEQENSKAYHTISDVIAHYRRHIAKMYAENMYREETYTGYASYIKIFDEWIMKRKNTQYIYQLNATILIEFLEYVFIERNNCAHTRDNYLTFMRVFASFLTQNQYHKTKFTEGILPFGKNKHKKQRTIIAEHDMLRLQQYLVQRNKHYLLACYVLHYCFIRPKEMSHLRISDISIERRTIFIREDISKSKKAGTVTIPEKVLKLMIELCIFNAPSHYYLFSKNSTPGAERYDEKQFRDFWTRNVRKDLKFSDKYKFYSLKDTGITNMLRKFDSITVRDQARHSSILMTDTYTPHDIQQANELIAHHDGIF